MAATCTERMRWCTINRTITSRPSSITSCLVVLVRLALWNPHLIYAYAKLHNLLETLASDCILTLRNTDTCFNFQELFPRRWALSLPIKQSTPHMEVLGLNFWLKTLIFQLLDDADFGRYQWWLKLLDSREWHRKLALSSRLLTLTRPNLRQCGHLRNESTHASKFILAHCLIRSPKVKKEGKEFPEFDIEMLHIFFGYTM